MSPAYEAGFGYPIRFHKGESLYRLMATGIHIQKARPTMTATASVSGNGPSTDLAAQIAALWAKCPTPAELPPQQPAKLPPLPEPLRCELDHRNPANWNYGPDRYRRTGFQQVTCKGCGRFYGYAGPIEKPKRSTT